MAGLVTLAAAVSGCGGSSPVSPASASGGKPSGSPHRSGHITTTSAVTSKTATARTRPGSNSLVATHTWTWDGHTSNGYRASFRFEDANPTSVSQAPLLDGFGSVPAVVDGCPNFNPGKDAVIPAQIEITNTTARLSAMIEVFVVLPDQPDSAIYYVADRVLCAPNGNEHNPGQSGFSFVCTFGPGVSCSVSFYVAVRGYFSTSHPRGDQTQLAGSEIQFCADGGCLESGSPLALTALTGPHASLHGGAAGGNRIDIGPL